MRHGLTWRRLAMGVVGILLVASGGMVAAQSRAADTITFEDTGESSAGCCAVPVELVVNAAIAEIRHRPGVLGAKADEVPGRLTIRFDPARVSRAELIAALRGYDFRPVGGQPSHEAK